MQPLQFAQLDAHALPQLRVEIRERLVQQEQLRFSHERARQREPLLLAAGELRRGAFLEALQPDESKRFRDHPPRLSPRRGLRADAERERDVLEHAHVRPDRVGLEDHPDVACVGRDEAGVT